MFDLFRMLAEVEEPELDALDCHFIMAPEGAMISASKL